MLEQPTLESQFGLIAEMVDKRYLLYAPKSINDLRVQYPDLRDYPEFGNNLKTHDLLFVWWMRNATSPYYDREDSDKLEDCIKMAYPTDQQRESKLAQFRQGMPEVIKAAFGRMESLNTSVRVENFLYTKQVRDNCKKLLGVNIEAMSPEDQESWSKQALNIWKLLKETSNTLESGGFGVVEQKDTMLDIDDGSVRTFRQSRR